jgi:uncharacterized DUF497 family protein
MEFEWDSAKAAGNLAKHGISLVSAMRVFDDPSAIVIRDRRDYGGEARYQAIGSAEGVVLVVSFTSRAAVYRIINARRASRRERTTYSLPAGSGP